MSRDLGITASGSNSSARRDGLDAFEEDEADEGWTEGDSDGEEKEEEEEEEEEEL